MLSTRHFGLAAIICCLSLPLSADTTVTTWRNDIGSTGQNIHETLLTPGNVNSATFGKYFAYAVDGYVYAQPLYVSGLNIAGGTHNAVFIATEHDSVYAMDADHNRQLWSASLVDTAHGAAAGATAVLSTDIAHSSIVPEVGITSTPVIDPATKTIYVVAKSKENGVFLERLHALDLTTGQEQPNSPVVISGSVRGTGEGSINGVIAFQPLIQSNRVSLLLLNGQVYIGYASYGDSGPYHGWIFSYDATTLQQTGIYNTSPAGSQGGVWEGGAVLAADTVIGGGRIFLTTGNGSFNANPPYSTSQDFGDSVVALTPSNGSLQVSDAWTPFDQNALNDTDKDQGSTGVLLLPDQPGSHVHELIQVGKNGRIEVLDRDNLGGYKTTANTNARQEIIGQIAGEAASTPAYWNNNVYLSSNDGPMLQYSLSNGLLSTSPVASSTHIFHRGPSPVTSSTGTSNGILWAIDAINNSTPASTLYAFDANNVSTALYNSEQNSARDRAGKPVKFTVPLVADGKVFVGAQSEVDVYGLLANAPPTTAAPIFTPAPGSFSSRQNVSLTDATSGAVTYYTTDGSVPTISSNRYLGPIAISATTTVRAMATATGLENSSVSNGTYTLAMAAARPTVLPVPGVYSSPQNVTLADTTSGAVIYYTTDLSTPTAASTRYQSPIVVSSSTTVRAMAVAPGFNSSAVVNGKYIIGIPAPTFSPAPGPYTSTQNVSLADAASGAVIYYTTDGSIPTTASAQYHGPIVINLSTTIKALATAPGLSTSAVSVGRFSITPTARPTVSPAPGVYTSAQNVTLSDTTSGAVIYYTTDLSTPTTASTQYQGPIVVSHSTTIRAMAVALGDDSSAVVNGKYIIGTH